MAGRPKVKQDLATLAELTIEDVDAIFELLATEQPMYKTAESFGVCLTALQDWIDANPERSERLKRARTRKAQMHAETALEIADTSAAEPGAKDKLRVGTRLRLASCYDRETYGEQKGSQVTINLATLHLDALRQRNTERAAEKRDVLTIDSPEQA